MKNTKTLRHLAMASVAILVLATAFSAAMAQGWGHGKGHGKGHGPDGPGAGLHRMLAHLDLTDDQKEQIHGMFEQHREATEATREQLREAHRQIMDLTHADTLDETAIRQAIADAAVLRADMAVDGARMFQQMRTVLTEEQLQKLGEMRTKMRERMDEQREFRHGWHGDPQDNADIDS